MIFVDWRETRDEKGAEIAKYLNAVSAELPCDYLIEAGKSTIAVERKTASGLLSDLASGRLFRQGRKFPPDSVKVLVIEGLIVPSSDGMAMHQTSWEMRGSTAVARFRKSGWRMSSVMGFIVFLHRMYDLVFQTADHLHTAAVLEELSRHFARRGSEALKSPRGQL